MASEGIGNEHVNSSTTIFITMVVMSTVAFYNVGELLFLVVITFKQYNGLYFWSLIVSSLGCFLHGLGFLLKFFQVTSLTYLSVTIITIGWYAMVTGQATVLWSRIHLVELNANIRKRLLYLIIFNAIMFHTPTTVLTYGSNAQPTVAANFIPAYRVMEKIQMTAFCLQEFLISAIYIRATWHRLPAFHDRGRKRILIHLFIVNVIIIILDLALLGTEYANLYTVQVLLKSAVYSIKLKLEFSILGQLIDLVRPVGRDYRSEGSRNRARSFASGFPAPASGMVTSDKVEQSRSAPNITTPTEVELTWLEFPQETSQTTVDSASITIRTPSSPRSH